MNLKEFAESKGLVITKESCPILVFKENLPESEVEELDKAYRLGIRLIPYCNKDDCKGCWKLQKPIENYTTLQEGVKKMDNTETYTAEQASQKALEWCKNHKGWKRICDIENSDILYKNWDELSDRIKKSWVAEYGKNCAESAWYEFGKKTCKVPYGFISGKGEFYKDILQVPFCHNMMMVFKVN